MLKEEWVDLVIYLDIGNKKKIIGKIFVIFKFVFWVNYDLLN